VSLVLAAALLFAQPQTDQIYLSTATGGLLAEQCGRSMGDVADFCTGYILGVADVLQAQRAICRPGSDVATRQTTEVVRRYLRDHPEQWHRHGLSIVRSALAEAFPCRRARR
jgi:hypothetical protein